MLVIVAAPGLVHVSEFVRMLLAVSFVVAVWRARARRLAVCEVVRYELATVAMAVAIVTTMVQRRMLRYIRRL